MQADTEAMEEEQSILQTEMQAEENGIFFVDSDDDDDDNYHQWGGGHIGTAPD